MDGRRKPYINGQVIIGIAAIIFGVLFLLDNMEILDARVYTQYWPVILIAIGVLAFVQPATPGGRVWGAILIIVGVVLLLRTMDIAYIRFRDLWPLLLILLGGSFVWTAITRKRAKTAQGTPTDTDSFVNGFALMSGFERSSSSQDFRGGDLTAVMGGCEIDLRQAVIKGEEAVINTFAFWGGIDIKVPRSWSVSIRGVPILGGFGDETTQPSESGAKKLVITGTAIMGGVGIKN